MVGQMARFSNREQKPPLQRSLTTWLIAIGLPDTETLGSRTDKKLLEPLEHGCTTWHVLKGQSDDKTHRLGLRNNAWCDM